MKTLQDYETMVSACVRCGFCQAHCPTFTATGTEPYLSRGRLEMIKACMDHRLSDKTPRYMERMNQCLLCGNCAQNCPPGVEGHKIIEAARADYIREKGLSGPFGQVAASIAEKGTITGDEPANRMLWINNILEELEGVGMNEPAEYAYFAGCVPTLYPSSYSIPQSFVRILKAAGLSFTLLGQEEICCGYPLLIGGLPERAREMALRNIELIKELGIKKVVTGCPSCFHIWKEEYPGLLEEELDIEIIHSTQMLLELIQSGALKFKEISSNITYHDPCDLGRKSGVFEEPREILQRIPGVSLREMKYNRLDARCCGGGGNLEVNDAGLSGKVAKDRVKQAQATGADTIVTACQQCKRTLQKGARLLQSRIKVKDICEIVSEALEERRTDEGSQRMNAG